MIATPNLETLLPGSRHGAYGCDYETYVVVSSSNCCSCVQRFILTLIVLKLYRDLCLVYSAHIGSYSKILFPL